MLNQQAWTHSLPISEGLSSEEESRNCLCFHGSSSSQKPFTAAQWEPVAVWGLWQAEEQGLSSPPISCPPTLHHPERTQVSERHNSNLPSCSQLWCQAQSHCRGNTSCIWTKMLVWFYQRFLPGGYELLGLCVYVFSLQFPVLRHNSWDSF